LAHSYSRIDNHSFEIIFECELFTGLEFTFNALMAAIFNVRIATLRGSVSSPVRKCAVPTDHCVVKSHSRTANCPTDLISYINRIASVTLETLYCLCVYMVVQLHAH